MIQPSSCPHNAFKKLDKGFLQLFKNYIFVQFLVFWISKCCYIFTKFNLPNVTLKSEEICILDYILKCRENMEHLHHGNQWCQGKGTSGHFWLGDLWDKRNPCGHSDWQQQQAWQEVLFVILKCNQSFPFKGTVSQFWDGVQRQPRPS